MQLAAWLSLAAAAALLHTNQGGNCIKTGMRVRTHHPAVQLRTDNKTFKHYSQRAQKLTVRQPGGVRAALLRCPRLGQTS